MKKSYESPELIVHGNVQQITAASNDSDRQDRIFNASGVENTPSGSTGSLDQCFFQEGTTTCIIAD